MSLDDPRIRQGLETQFRLRRRLLDGGARNVGWKVGFGAPSGLKMLDITGPLLGFLTDATLLPDRAEIAVGHATRPIIEEEVAVYLGSDLGPGATPEEAAAAVSAVGAAIEVADIDISPLAPGAVEGILSGDIFHTAFILGEPDTSRAGIVLDGLTPTITKNGEAVTLPSHLEEITGSYAGIVAAVADTLAALGETLRAGDFIITGSIVPPIPLAPGDEVVFELAPLAPLTARFRA